MIKAYLAASSMLYEGEDIEIRYSLIQDDLLIKNEMIYIEYVKPVLVGMKSVLTLLMKLEKYKEDEINIIFNDPSLHEIIKGTSTTKNGEVLKMASKMRKELSKFKNLSFTNVFKTKEPLADWKMVLEIQNNESAQ